MAKRTKQNLERRRLHEEWVAEEDEIEWVEISIGRGPVEQVRST